MPHYHAPRQSQERSFYPYSTNYYPGVNPYETVKAEASALVPFAPQSPASTSLPGEAAGSTAKAGGGFSIPNLGDLKGIVERLGGIEGILATMGKVQKVMQTVQQFAPMAKMFAGLLPGGGKKSAKLQGGGLDEYSPKRRKTSRKKSTRKGSSGSRNRNSTSKRGKSTKRRR